MIGGKKSKPEPADAPQKPKKSSRSHSQVLVGRTITEKRERPETKNERAAARKKDKHKNARRVVFVTIGFIMLAAILVYLGFTFLGQDREGPSPASPEATTTAYEPTIEIVDEDASATGGKITSRMREYIGQAEADFKDLGYTPVKAVLPANAIREVDFYLDGYTGFIKLIIDRDSAISVEDADRMLRYLAAQGVSEFRYIDVRIDGKAFWQ